MHIEAPCEESVAREEQRAKFRAGLEGESGTCRSDGARSK